MLQVKKIVFLDFFQSKKQKMIFYSLVFCFTRMFNRYILMKCYVILLRNAIANIWGWEKCVNGKSISVTPFLK